MASCLWESNGNFSPGGYVQAGHLYKHQRKYLFGYCNYYCFIFSYRMKRADGFSDSVMGTPYSINSFPVSSKGCPSLLSGVIRYRAFDSRLYKGSLILSVSASSRRNAWIKPVPLLNRLNCQAIHTFFSNEYGVRG